MNIKQRILMTQNSTGLCLFNEGIFLRFYNQSAYILSIYWQYSLKFGVRHYKELTEQVISGGILKDRFTPFLANAIEHKWGYELHQPFDLSGYQDWRQYLLTGRLSSANSVHSSSALADGESTGAAAPNWIYIQLNNKQYQFIQNWQARKYTLQHHDAFIDSLQKRLFNIKS